VQTVNKSESVNLLEPSEPVQVCNGIALPLPLPYYIGISQYTVQKTYSLYGHHQQQQQQGENHPGLFRLDGRVL